MARAASPRMTDGRASRNTHAYGYRDLSAATLALVAPVLARHGITSDEWARAGTGVALAKARPEAALLLHAAGYSKAAISRALGVDRRMPAKYLRDAGLETGVENPEEYDYNPRGNGSKVRLPFAGPMQPGRGPRHDCMNEAACLKGLLREARARKIALPSASHCPDGCKDMAAITRDTRYAEAAQGLEQPMGRPW